MLNSTLPPSLKLRHLWPIADQVEVLRRQLRTRTPEVAPPPSLHSWQVDPWNDHGFTLLFTGSAGGGKSYLAAQMLHHFCLDNPGAMALALRKTRESMKNSTVLFLWRKIVGKAAKHNQSAHRFEYDNGSVLAYGGMKDEEQREQVRSIGQDGGVDIIWMEEATAFEEEDFNELIARCRARAGAYRQIILTTNPDAPTHWIYRRLIVGGDATVYYSRAADNPMNPPEYIDNLNQLTGTEGDRLARGQWVQASGIVFDVWTDPGNVTEDAEYIPDAGPIFWALDDGYSAGGAAQTSGRDPKTGYYVADSHPRVILLVQQRDDGRLCVFAEDYACLKLSDQHISEMLALPYPAPDVVVHGPGAAEIRGRIFAANLAAHQSTADVEESVKELRRAMAADVNGWRRVLVHPRCVQLRAEMASYRRDATTGKVIKQFDHGPDALRGLVWILRQ